MEKYKDNHLLFLHDRRVPPTNNLALSSPLGNPHDLSQAA
jgi:hypothetical protein